MMAGRRVVFDTGSLVSAALRASSPADRALALALRHGVVCVCGQTMQRLRAALSTSKFDRYMRKSARMAFAEMLLRNAWVCPVSPAGQPKPRSAFRNRRNYLVLALAVVGEADVIVSGDTGLLARKAWRRIPIMTPAEFIDRFDPA